MPTQQQINEFALEFHQRALVRVRSDQRLLARAKETIRRWRDTRGATPSDPYLRRWETLLDQGIDAVESEILAETDDAATMRSMSPFGFALSPAERTDLLRRHRS